MTGIPYGDIIINAAFPALIYYLYLMGAVHLRAVKIGLDTTTNKALTEEFAQNEGLWITCLRNLHFFIAVTYLVWRSDEHTSELQSLLRISHAIFCLQTNNLTKQH